MKIYTRKGDEGSTGLFGGATVSKADSRVEAYGLVDEANAVLGWARTAGPPPRVDEVLQQVQQTCFAAGAWLASGPGADPGIQAITAGDVEALELAIDRLEEGLPPLKHFVLPGGGEAGARLHVARTVTRRAERAVVALAAVDDVPAPILAWLNRLSDLLFVAARAANADAGVDETVWAPRTS